MLQCNRSGQRDFPAYLKFCHKAKKRPIPDYDVFKCRKPQFSAVVTKDILIPLSGEICAPLYAHNLVSPQ